MSTCCDFFSWPKFLMLPVNFEDCETAGLRWQLLKTNAVCKLMTEGLREQVLKTNIKWPGILKSSQRGA